jgi:hypothetical protein
MKTVLVAVAALIVLSGCVVVEPPLVQYPAPSPPRSVAPSRPRFVAPPRYRAPALPRRARSPAVIVSPKRLLEPKRPVDTSCPPGMHWLPAHMDRVPMPSGMPGRCIPD